MSDLATAVSHVITADDVRAAAARIAGRAMRTPLLENAVLNERVGGRVFLKPEVLQHCGSFKIRGAYNRIAQLSEEERAKGVVAWSSGNHAQGVAYAARLFGIKATIVMPEDAPASKVRNVKRLGGEIVVYDRYTEDREAIGRALAEEMGAQLVPSYDHPHVIAGQGTTALETLEDLAAQDVKLDQLAICCGGGSLSAGCATITKDMSPSTHVYVVEPEGYDETRKSLETGERHHADISRKSICDAIMTPTPGKLTLPILQHYVDGGLVVTEEEVLDAMAFAFTHLKLVVEPGGAVALAALLAGKMEAADKATGIVLSGGNVDQDVFARRSRASGRRDRARPVSRRGWARTPHICGIARDRSARSPRARAAAARDRPAIRRRRPPGRRYCLISEASPDRASGRAP